MASEIATRTSWKIKPLPRARKKLKVTKRYSAEDFARIAHGLIPEEMEQRWFVFFEKDWLYLHRSWTGICIYKVRLAPKDGQFEIAEVWANRDPEQFTQTDDVEDAQQLLELIQLLIGGQL